MCWVCAIVPHLLSLEEGIPHPFFRRVIQLNDERYVHRPDLLANDIYGDPDDPSQPTGDDKVLPRELKDRVNRYIEKREHTDKDEFKKEIEDSSSFNAFIRKEIKRGNL